MDPEGATPQDNATSMVTGNAIWTYRKPIFTAVVLPKEEEERPQGSSNQAEAVPRDDDSSSVESDLPDLIPANIYTPAAKRARTSNNAGTQTDAQDDATIPVSEDSDSLSDESADDHNAADDVCDHWLLSSLYKYSLIFGLLVGCFIQSSSLGANYILMVVFGRDFVEMAKHHNRIVAFSLAWSFLTSLMGIVILLILRSLVSLASHGLNQHNLAAGRRTVFLNRQLSLVAFLEFPFAFGALTGVCGSWAATDLVLGLHSHAYHSLITLAVAYVGKVIFEACSQQRTLLTDDEDDCADDWSDKKALIASGKKKKPHQVVKDVHVEFKIKGLATGLLVGFFIQFSSLGASFLIDALVTNNGAVALSKQSLLIFSLGWSFVFGTMGVTILLLLRYLVGIVCDHILSQSEGSDLDEEEEMADRWSVSLEFFFAVGCLVGVNIAWLITDVGLGLNAHVWRSLITLAAAAVWCVVLAQCFGFRPSSSGRARGSKKMVTRATQTSNGVLIV